MPTVRRSGEEGGQPDTPFVMQLTSEEHRRLKVAAAQGDTTMAALVRNALRAAGPI